MTRLDHGAVREGRFASFRGASRAECETEGDV
jgi:hypothetical protein